MINHARVAESSDIANIPCLFERLHTQVENARLTKDGDVRSMATATISPVHQADELGTSILAPATDVHAVASLIYRMSTGDEKVPVFNSASPAAGEVSAKINDPLKCELVSRTLLAATKPSAEDLVKIISELAPFDVRSFSKSTRELIVVEEHAKAAGMEQAKLQAATPCVMICDPGNGIGCEVALVQMRALRDLGHIEPLGVIVNMWPSSERARLLRGTLDVLGMPHVPVGVGSNGGPNDHTECAWKSAQSYMTPPSSEREGSIVTGHQLLQIVFEKARPASITLLCTSSLKDAAIFLRDSGTPNTNISPKPHFTRLDLDFSLTLLLTLLVHHVPLG